nr:hypothetical protein [Tanacetum cinerariifolium]
MGEPLSPDCVFDFPVDEPEPHTTYDFFMPGLLPGYAGNLNNNNGWTEADVPLLGELGVVTDEPMDDDFERFKEEEVWEENEECTDGSRHTTFDASGSPTERLRVIKDLSTRLGNLEYGYRHLVKKVIQVMGSQMVHAADRFKQIGTQVEQGQQTATQRDEVITRLTQQVHVAFDVSTDGRKEDFFLEMESSGSIVANVPGTKLSIETLYATSKLVSDMKKATKASKLDYRLQQQSKGLSERSCIVPEVPDEPKDISSSPSSSRSSFDDETKDISNGEEVKADENKVKEGKATEE